MRQTPAQTAAALDKLKASLDTRGKRALYVRLIRGQSQRHVAITLGFHPQALQKLEADEIKKTSMLTPLGKFYNVSVDWLEFGSKSVPAELPPYESAVEQKHRGVPIIDWDKIKPWCSAKGKLVLDKACRYLHFDNVSSQAYALCISNDAMVATIGNVRSFHKGGFIIVDPALKPKDGGYVIAMLPNSKEIIFRQYLNDGRAGLLKPLNPQYAEIKLDKKTVILGVVAAYVDFTPA